MGKKKAKKASVSGLTDDGRSLLYRHVLTARLNGVVAYAMLLGIERERFLDSAKVVWDGVATQVAAADFKIAE